MSRAGLQGHLRLVCGVNEKGASFLRAQTFRAPAHISKSHWDGRTLLVQMVNPTAGLFAGDILEISAGVESGARLALSAPSACRVHQMGKDERAIILQDFVVAAGSRLEVRPQLFIPQAGARCRQRTTIHVEPGGELIYFEVIAPGRVAAGEAFLYDSLDVGLQLRFGTELIARERYVLSAGSGSLRALTAIFPAAYFANCFVISPELPPDFAGWPEVRNLESEDICIGQTPLSTGGWLIKLLARDALHLRHALAMLQAAVATVYTSTD